ncbi:MAG: hypothetical protein KIS67_28620 [Verrucomicrobiae bacterium]|nr:hypothetical protein [Verrucomicrobiae bacterium]
MEATSTPLTTFHHAVRVTLEDNDHEVHAHFKINETIKVVLNTGQIPGYRLSTDGSSVEPALTPDSDQTAYALLIKKTALMIRQSLTDDQIFHLEADVYKLQNGDMCGGSQ